MHECLMCGRWSQYFDFCSTTCADNALDDWFYEDFRWLCTELDQFKREMVELEVAFLMAAFTNDYELGFYEVEW